MASLAREALDDSPALSLHTIRRLCCDGKPADYGHIMFVLGQQMPAAPAS